MSENTAPEWYLDHRTTDEDMADHDRWMAARARGAEQWAGLGAPEQFFTALSVAPAGALEAMGIGLAEADSMEVSAVYYFAEAFGMVAEAFDWLVYERQITIYDEHLAEAATLRHADRVLSNPAIPEADKGTARFRRACILSDRADLRKAVAAFESFVCNIEDNRADAAANGVTLEPANDEPVWQWYVKYHNVEALGLDLEQLHKLAHRIGAL